MVRRLFASAVLLCGTAGLVLAADYKNATLVEFLKGDPIKTGPNVAFEYEYTNKKTKKTETKRVEVLISPTAMVGPGALDENGKKLKLERLNEYWQPGVVADIKTEKRKDGIELVTAFKTIKPPPPKEDKKKDK